MEVNFYTLENEPEFRRLKEVAKFRALTDRERKAYRESLKVYRDNYAIMETERTEGRAEGLAEGRAQTIADKTKLARDMGLPEDVIAQLFGLQ